MDQMHVLEPTIAAMEAGYDVLLEKPMADTLEGCVPLVQQPTAYRSHFADMSCVALFTLLDEAQRNRDFGKIGTGDHGRTSRKCLLLAHGTQLCAWQLGQHSASNPMILAKCCHDLDVLFWNFGRVKRLHSFGRCFTTLPKVSAPIFHCAAPMAARSNRVVPFLRQAIYLDFRPFKQMAETMGKHYDVDPDYPNAWPFTAITEDVSYAGRLKALQEGPYGRCVYRCDNDVVDNQVVSMEMESGATVTLDHAWAFAFGRTHPAHRWHKSNVARCL